MPRDGSLPLSSSRLARLESKDDNDNDNDDDGDNDVCLDDSLKTIGADYR
jgi:hypothetical protein